MNVASKRALRVAVHVPVAPATLAALLGGHRGALEDDPVMARMLAILRAPGALGDFGIYHGVGEIGLGWETFAPAPDAKPTLGAAGEIAHSPTVTLVSWIPADAPAEAIDAALAALMEAHPWEVPVIEVTETRLLVRAAEPADYERVYATSETPLTNWLTMDRTPRLPVTTLTRSSIPTHPGVYAFYRNGKRVYVGKASSLRQRVWGNHCGRGSNLGSSALRRNIAEHLEIASPSDIKSGRYQPTPSEVADVRRWLEECEVAWVQSATTNEAEALEGRLKQEFLPILTKL